MLETVKAFADANELGYVEVLEELARQRLATVPYTQEVLALARRRVKQRQQGEEEAATDAGTGFPP